MQVVRRDIKERRKQIHVVTLVHMQFIKTTHCNQTTCVLAPVSLFQWSDAFYDSSELASHTTSSVGAAR